MLTLFPPCQLHSPVTDAIISCCNSVLIPKSVTAFIAPCSNVFLKLVSEWSSKIRRSVRITALLKTLQWPLALWGTVSLTGSGGTAFGRTGDLSRMPQNNWYIKSCHMKRNTFQKNTSASRKYVYLMCAQYEIIATGTDVCEKINCWIKHDQYWDCLFNIHLLLIHSFRRLLADKQEHLSKI